MHNENNKPFVSSLDTADVFSRLRFPSIFFFGFELEDIAVSVAAHEITQVCGERPNGVHSTSASFFRPIVLLFASEPLHHASVGQLGGGQLVVIGMIEAMPTIWFPMY